MDSQNRPETIKEWWAYLKTKGLRDTVSVMTVSQIYSVSATVVAIGAAVLAAFPGLIKRPSDHVHCWQAHTYPRGEWLVSGKTTVYDTEKFKDATPGILDRIDLKSETVGSTTTDEENSGGADIRIDGQVAPSGHVTMTLEDPESHDPAHYVAIYELEVSADGCRMSGRWSDNYDKAHPGERKQKGTAILIWNRPTSFWIRRDVNQDSSGSNPPTT
jgi:hypothetical protein